MNKASNVNKGVTVLELLLTIALSAIIFAAIYGVFIAGLKIWEVENPKSLVQQGASSAMNRIERELKKAGNIIMALDTAVEFGTFPVNSPRADSWTVSLWHFNDGLGSGAIDAVGNNNASFGPGSESPVWIADGEDSAALNFDGSNDYVDCGSGSTLNITSKLELDAWIRPGTGSTTGAIFYKTGAYRLYINSSNKLVGSIYYSGAWHDAASSSGIVRNGSVWTHTALSYNKDEGGTEELKVYINGVIEGTADNSDFIAVSSNNLYIGRDRDNTQYPFAGAIDEARISNNVRRTRISWGGAADKLTLFVNGESRQLEDGWATTFQINYYDTGYNLLTTPGGTDTQTKRNAIKSVKVSLGLENIIALRKEVLRASSLSETTIVTVCDSTKNNFDSGTYNSTSYSTDHMELNARAALAAINKGTPFSFDVNLGKEPVLSRIDSTNYLAAYVGPANSGRAVILTVNTATKTITMGTPFEYDTNNGSVPAIIKIDPTNYLVAYRGSGNSGWSVILYLVQQAIYYDSGIYESSVKDASQVARWNKLSWNETLYNSTDIRFQARSGNTNPIAGNYAGPDGEGTSYYTDPDGADSTGNNINASNNRYFQYKAYLSALDSTVTSKLNSVTITYDTNLSGITPYIYKWEEIFE